MTYKILLADDQPHNLIILKQFLRHTGKEYVTLEAKNGREACDIAYRESPDLIIIDWEMPEMDGIEAIKELKANKKTFMIPIIMATAHDSPEHVKHAMDVGAMDFVIKPSNKVELSARVNSALRLHDLNQENQRKTHEIIKSNNYIKERSKFYVSLKNRIFIIFLAYSFLAFLVSVASFVQFKRVDKSWEASKLGYSAMYQVQKMLDADQELLTEEVLKSQLTAQFVRGIFEKRTSARDSAIEFLDSLNQYGLFEVADETEDLKKNIQEYGLVFNESLNLSLDISDSSESDANGQKRVIQLIERTKESTKKTKASLNQLLDKMQSESDSLLWWFKWFVVVIVTVTVIFTMFLTVSMQFFFEKDNELDEVEEFGLSSF